MPCSPGMRKCRRGCLHRMLVDDYRSERHRQVIERENATGGYESEIAEYGQIVTFKSWLQQMAGGRQEEMSGGC